MANYSYSKKHRFVAIMKLWSCLLLVFAVILSIVSADIMPATFNITKYLDTYPPSFLAKIYLPKQVIGLKIRGEFDYLTPTSHGYIKTPGPFNVAGFYSVVFTDDLDDLAIFFEREGEEDTTFEFWGQSIGSYKVERLEGNAIASKKRQSMYQQSF